MIMLILAIIALVVFAHMSLYVAGAVLGILLVIIASIIKRRRQR
jgi:hypothetical protein